MKLIVGGALFNDGKLLVVKRTKTRTMFPGKWEMPGGRLEEGETYEKALRREFAEETGIQIHIQKVYYEFKYKYEGKPAKDRRYIVTANNFNVKLNPQEHTDFKWASREEISTLDMTRAEKKSIEKAFEETGQ